MEVTRFDESQAIPVHWQKSVLDQSFGLVVRPPASCFITAASSARAKKGRERKSKQRDNTNKRVVL